MADNREQETLPAVPEAPRDAFADMEDGRGRGELVPMARYDRGFERIAEAAFPDAAVAVLRRPVDPRLVEVKPNGIVYLPWVHVAQRLNEAFGPGAWSIAPRDRPATMGSTVVYFGALYIRGQFVREAAGECEYRQNNDQMSYASAFEGAISDCLVRCCKVLGIGWELWDPSWREVFMAAAVRKAWVDGRDGRKGTWMHWRADRPEPWQVTKAKARPQPAGDLDPQDARVVAMRAALQGGEPAPPPAAKRAPPPQPTKVDEFAHRAVPGVVVQVTAPEPHPDGEPYAVDMEGEPSDEPTPEEIGELFGAPTAKAAKAATTKPGKITAAQHKALEAGIAEYAKAWGQDPKVTRAKLKNVMGKEFSVEHFPDLTPEQFEHILRFVKPRPRHEGDKK